MTSQVDLDARQTTSAGEILNCDLTEANGTSLDPNNLNHFIESAVTDFYLRFNVDVVRSDAQRGIFQTTAILKRRQIEFDDVRKEICQRFFQ